MISIKVTNAGESVSGAEMSKGTWVVAPERFAEFFEMAQLPESFTALGGTVAIVSDWMSEDDFTRVSMFERVAQNYFDEKFGGLSSPITVDARGMMPLDENVAPENAVF